MESSTTFWLGIGLALPIGIGVNLLTPLLQRWIAKTSAKRQARYNESLQQERRFAEALAEDIASYIAYAVISFLKSAGYLAGFLVILGLFWAIDTIAIDIPNYEVNYYSEYSALTRLLIVVLDAAQDLAWLTTGILILNSIRKPLRIVRQVERIRASRIEGVASIGLTDVGN